MQPEVANVPVLLLSPPGKGKRIPSSHLVQGSQQPWQAGRAGPKETRFLEKGNTSHVVNGKIPTGSGGNRIACLFFPRLMKI